MAHHTNEEIEVLPEDYDLTLAADGGNEDMQQSTAIRLPSDADELSMIGAPSSSKKKYVVGATVLGIVAVTAVAIGVVSSNENKTSNVSSSINAMENNAFVAARSSKGSKSSSSKSGKSSSSYSRSNNQPGTVAPVMSPKPKTSAPTLAPATSSPMTSAPTSSPMTSAPTFPCFGANGTELKTAAADYQNQNCATTPTCTVQNTYGPIETWCTGDVTDMTDVFNADDIPDGNPVFLQFNADISGWDVSNVQTFRRMFRKTQNFSPDLSNWELSSVTSLQQMFQGANLDYQDLSSWESYIGGVTSFKDMFKKSNIDQSLCNWNSNFPYATADVLDMFTGANNCENKTSPIQEVGGPFCFNCGPTAAPSPEP